MTHFFRQRVHTLWVLVCVMVLSGFAACKKTDTGGGAVSSANDLTGEITLMMWSGDGIFRRDIGKLDIPPTELTGENTAGAYGTAKAFNKIYPNVKVNIYAKIGSPDEDAPWAQHRENFRMETGVAPDLYVATDMIGDMQKGLIADLSIFKDDPMYKTFNPQLMDALNIDGRQFGVPMYMLLWGVYVNRTLAESLNIDIPDPDWTIEEYTRFINHSRPNEYYGSMGGPWNAELNLINTGTRDFNYQLLNRRPGDPYVNANSEALRSLFRYVDQWAANAVWPNYEHGRISDEFMDDNWWWSWKYFLDGKLLSLSNDPWMMGSAAHPDPDNWATVKVDDWDMYPRPSTPYMGNHVGIVLDPWVIRNYAMDDGNPELSPEEEAKLKVAWEFVKFWSGDTRSWEARANQFWLEDNTTLKPSLSDGYPMVSGPEFNRQMDVWYSVDMHTRYKDKNKMPGFQKMLELWEQGQFWDISGKIYPWYYDFEGSRRSVTYEWDNSNSAEVTGAAWGDTNWLDQVYARLPGWNTSMNQRWEIETARVQEALNRYYPR